MSTVRRYPVVIGAALLLGPFLLAVPLAHAATPTCHGFDATIVGTSGADHLTGTSGNDVIVGLGGNDTIRGKGGNDTICGGAGDDQLFGQGGSDFVSGGGANDSLSGGTGKDDLNGGSGTDSIDGGGGKAATPADDRGRALLVCGAPLAGYIRAGIVRFHPPFTQGGRTR